jgi:hypothetical protein
LQTVKKAKQLSTGSRFGRNQPPANKMGAKRANDDKRRLVGDAGGIQRDGA